MGSMGMISMVAVAAAAIFYGGAASAQSGNVQIVRGGQPAKFGETREANVVVLRGTPAARPAAAARQVAAAGTVREVVAAGPKLWLVDRGVGTITACRLVSTPQVGEQRIDCHAGSLPR